MGWKLVRDRNQEHLEGRVSGQWRVNPDRIGPLVRKLGEEYGEFTEARDPAELYDLLDVVEELIVQLDRDGQHEERHAAKVKLMGGFTRSLEWHPNPDLDLWATGEGSRIKESA